MRHDWGHNHITAIVNSIPPSHRRPIFHRNSAVQDMNHFSVDFCAALALTASFSVQATTSFFIEDLTWQEVQTAIQDGKRTALYYAGSTEQNGPHMVTGKHNLIAHHVASRIAKELGNALVYPVMPFAPTGDPADKSGHMAYPGSVSVEDDIFAHVARNVAESAAAAGFSCIILMGDHGGGQAALGKVAREFPNSESSRGITVVHAIEVYEQSNALALAYLKRAGLPYGDHASIIDTSELMYVSPQSVRMGKLKLATEKLGSSGFASLASPKLGKIFIEYKVQTALARIRASTDCGG